MIAGAVVVVGLSQPVVLLLFIPLIPLAWILSSFCLRTSLQLKRLESISRSPIYNLFSSSVNGLSTIRAFDVLDTFLRLFENKTDTNTRAYIPMIGVTSWLGFWLDLLVAIIVCFTAFISIFLRSTISPSAAALSLMYSINLTTRFQWSVQQLTESLILMTSAERIDEYGQLPREEDENNHGRLIKTSPEWPDQGMIEFRNYSLRYRSHLDDALKNINFFIEPRQKIGIIGRTGSGKSSLFRGLCRLVDQTNVEGKILIDNIDISRIQLSHLRAHLSIIPQQPILFSGTLRYNLDPFNQYTDEQCWNVLEAVRLKDIVRERQGGLLFTVAESGYNLSTGQCQLICIARALLKKSQILLIDEATANVDQETDQLIQTIINNQFQDRTVLTIAHRLGTIATSDKFLMLDKGKIASF